MVDLIPSSIQNVYGVEWVIKKVKSGGRKIGCAVVHVEEGNRSTLEREDFVDPADP